MEPADAANGHELEELELDFACSSCNADLGADEPFRTLRVCGTCGRHYWLSARERIALLADPGSFTETSADLASLDPLLVHDRLPVPDRLAEARELPAAGEAVVTGTATIDGHGVVLIALDLAVIGSSIGIIAGEKVALAMELAVTRRLPVLAICSGGGGRTREGLLALAQVSKLASAAARLRRVGVPFVALLTHPTGGNALLGVANQADIVFAEPGAQISLGRGDARSLAAQLTTEALAEGGMIDGIVPRSDQRTLLSRLLGLFDQRGVARSAQLPAPLAASSLPAPIEAEVCRDPARPDAGSYLDRLAEERVGLAGDRVLGDDPGVLGALCRIDGVACVAIGLDRGAVRFDAATFAKVTRLLRLAGHLELPVVTLIETNRAADAIDHAAAHAMSRTLAAIVESPTPVVAVAIGEVAGLAGLALFAGDRTVMLEHAVVAQGSQDPVASARDCLRLGMVEVVVAEPDPSAAAAPDDAAAALRIAIGNALAELGGVGPRRLLDDRTRKLRQLGLGTQAGREIALLEVREMQDLQRLVGRSWEDLRHRWEGLLPNLPQLAGRPSLPAITLPRINVRRPDLGELASRVATARRALRPGPAEPRDDPAGPTQPGTESGLVTPDGDG